MKRPATWLAALALLLGFLVGSTPADREPEARAFPVVAPGIAAPTAEWESPEPSAGGQQPVHLRIPSLDVAADITPVGMSDASTMQVPADISVVGWFNRSMFPVSDSGNTVLVGHRDGVSDPNGVFRNLSHVRRGETIRVRDMAGRRLHYSVTDVELVSDKTFARRAREIFATQGAHSLVLITCGGVFDATRGGYQSTVVVTARRT